MKKYNRFFKYIIYLLIIILFIVIINNYKTNILDFFNGILVSFHRTLIIEDRYLLYLKGLSATLIVSILSIIIGTILGFILFLIRMFNNKVINILIKTLVMLIQGTPITVLLLIFYYVIFATININPIYVGIITFSLYFSIYMEEVFKSSYSSINKNQIISAYALGFNKYKTLKLIIIPQVLYSFLPVFKNESVTLIKLTSILGYISVMDLTKATDIIRNRTYEAFFPLIFTALIYFVICYLVNKILDYFYKKVNTRGEQYG